MEQGEIRRTAIIAMFSDDVLMEKLVLKGGNALDIVHGITARGSLDIDFSMEDDFENLEDIQERIFRALRDRFDAVGMLVFDEKFGRKPKELREGQDERWGGYRVEFKLIPRDLAAKLEDGLDRMRVNAEVVGFAQEKVFRIEISKYEYCAPKAEAELDAFTIYVYTPAMIAAEKLRAICQQMPEYPQVRNKRARARDFYDLHSVITRAGVEFNSDEFQSLVKDVFAAKEVPTTLLASIPNFRDFHAQDWPSVTLALTENAEPFDFYFDFVLEQLSKLEATWKV